ncbi:MAG: hypothetical protein U0521_03980 [Anaerolineae bacterium]
MFSVSNDLSYGTTYVQVAELLIGYWDAVGVKVTLNSMANDQFTENKENNNLQATIYTGEGGAGVTAILDPRYYVPGEYFGMYGNGWFAWRTHSTEAVAVEMPQDMQDLRAAYENVLAQPTVISRLLKWQSLCKPLPTISSSSASRATRRASSPTTCASATSPISGSRVGSKASRRSTTRSSGTSSNSRESPAVQGCTPVRGASPRHAGLGWKESS